MYHPDITLFFSYPNLLAAGTRLLELFKLSLKATRFKDNGDTECLKYFVNEVNKNATVLDIGSHYPDYLHTLLKISRRSGKVVAFETNPASYQYLSLKQEMLQLKNVRIEPVSFSGEIETALTGRQMCSAGGATIIDFRKRLLKSGKRVVAETLDNYCDTYDIKPDLLKISCEGNELAILNGAINILSNHKPKVMITCVEKHAGRDRIREIFTMLADLDYSGYFMLGDTKVPVANFDFNIYQNPHSNFFCKDFIFE